MEDLCDMANNLVDQQAVKDITRTQLKDELREGIKKVVKLDIGVSDSCGLSLACEEEELKPVWSAEEEKLKREGI